MTKMKVLKDCTLIISQQKGIETLNQSRILVTITGSWVVWPFYSLAISIRLYLLNSSLSTCTKIILHNELTWSVTRTATGLRVYLLKLGEGTLDEEKVKLFFHLHSAKWYLHVL